MLALHRLAQATMPFHAAMRLPVVAPVTVSVCIQLRLIGWSSVSLIGECAESCNYYSSGLMKPRFRSDPRVPQRHNCSYGLRIAVLEYLCNNNARIVSPAFFSVPNWLSRLRCTLPERRRGRQNLERPRHTAGSAPGDRRPARRWLGWAGLDDTLARRAGRRRDDAGDDRGGGRARDAGVLPVSCRALH
jgi:hypothetical protein